MIQQAFSNSWLVKFISNDVCLVFSLYRQVHISCLFQIACLGHGLHRVLDAIGECEQHTKEMGMRESSSTWRLYFRREFFTPWYEPGDDTQATELTYQQIMRGVSVGEYKCDKVIMEHAFGRLMKQKGHKYLSCNTLLFDLILYVLSTIFQFKQGWFFLG